LIEFRNWFRGVWLFSLHPQDMAPSAEAESGIGIAGIEFVAWYRTLAQETPEMIPVLCQDLAGVIPGLKAMRLIQIGLTSRMLAFVCDISNQEIMLFLNELSDGQRVLLVLYTVLRAIAAKAKLIIFDEPDNFVAAGEIQPWLAAIRDAVNAGGAGTLIIISHHPEVIDYLAPDHTVHLARASDGPTRSRTMEFDRTKGLAASELLRLME